MKIIVHFSQSVLDYNDYACGVAGTAHIAHYVPTSDSVTIS